MKYEYIVFAGTEKDKTLLLEFEENWFMNMKVMYILHVLTILNQIILKKIKLHTDIMNNDATKDSINSFFSILTQERRRIGEKI